jgi:hypothetical protein
LLSLPQLLTIYGEIRRSIQSLYALNAKADSPSSTIQNSLRTSANNPPKHSVSLRVECEGGNYARTLETPILYRCPAIRISLSFYSVRIAYLCPKPISPGAC